MRLSRTPKPITAEKTAKTGLLGGFLCALALLAVGAIVFRYLPMYGRSNVWKLDGLTQHFPALYETNLLLRGLLRGKGLQLWSFHLGFGGDLIGSLSYYLADPFALLSLAVPMSKLEYAYEALFFLRLLCAGLAAYAYLRKLGAKAMPSIVGSMTYVFTTYTLFSALRHPHFADPLVWFPLVLLGIELVLEKRRPYLLVAAVFLSAFSNFYFFYQISIIAVLYAVARYLEVTPKGERLRRLAPSGLRVAGLYALGIALAAVTLVPVLTAFLGSSRAAGRPALSLLYDVSFYRSYLIALTSAQPGGNSLYAGFSILGFLAMPVIFMRRKQNATLKFMLLLFPLFLVFPVFGSLFNGVSFPSYRFVFMWGLFLSAAIALLLSDPRALKRREVLAMGVGLAVYSAAVIWAARGAALRVTPFLVLGAAMLLLFAIEAEVGGARRDPGSAVRAGIDPRKTSPAPAWLSPALRIGVVLLVVAGIGMMSVASFDARYSGRLKGYVARGHVLKKFERNAGNVLGDLPGADVARVDKQRPVHGTDLKVAASNDSLVQGYNGVAFYYSVASSGVIDYLRAMDDRAMRLAFDYSGLDDRAALEALGGVRYYASKPRGQQYVPYGFVPRKRTGKTTIFENLNTLPLGFVYHSQVPSATFDAMKPVERQQALLQGVVLDPALKTALPSIVPSTGVIDVPYSTDTSGAIAFDPSTKSVSTSGRNAQINLHFAPVENSELYVDMTGISFSGLGERKLLHIAAGTQGPSKTERVEPTDLPYYWGDNSTLINLGYSRPVLDRAYVRFVEPARVSYKDLHVYAVPMEHFAEQVHALADEGLQDVRIGQNTVSGKVTSKGSGLLYLSIPYSSGWTATVDGRPAKIVRANVGFSGIPVASGTHRVVLRYVTPGLVTGLRISLVAILGLLGVFIVEARRRHPL